MLQPVVTRVLPSGNQPILGVWYFPSSGETGTSRSSLPESACQRCKPGPELREASVLPSGDQAKPALPLCSFRVWRTFPEAASQILTVQATEPSVLAEASFLPS